MCGKPAAAGGEAKLTMFAPSASNLDGLGFPVQGGQGRDKVRVEMPRCAACRSWVTGWMVVIAIVTVTASLAGILMQSVFFSGAALPSGLAVHHEGIGNIGTGVGFMLGFVAALLAMAWKRKRSGRRSANSYPPVVRLRKLGWSFISD